MATSKSLSNANSVIRIDIDGKKYRLEFSHSNNAAELRTLLTKRYHISSSTHFLDGEDYTVFPDDEESITISQLLNENDVIKLVTDKSEPMPEKKNKLTETKQMETSYPSRKPALRELRLTGSLPVLSDNKIVLPTDLDLGMWERIFRNCNLLYGIRMDGETPIRAFKFVLKFRESNEDYPPFQVTDGSNIRAYMKDKLMQSSFVSSKFFDAGIGLSSPFLGIGINAEYSKSKTTTKTKKKTYLTYCYNFPRVTLQLDLSYLEPTTEFLQAIDTVLEIPTPDEQVFQLEKVLAKYGHVYPTLVVLGGHLYHTEEHHTQEEAEEARKRISAETSFSSPLVQPVKANIGAGSEKKEQNKSSEQTSLLTFEAVGGDTRFNRDPTLWTATIADPSLWRIIEQDQYQSVITLLDHERQQKLKELFSYHTKKKMLGNLYTKWKHAAITVAGGNGRGNQLNQLYLPHGVCIDSAQNIYIADFFNHRILKWTSNATQGQIIAGGNGEGNQTNQLNWPTDMIIEPETNSMVIADRGNCRVVRWPCQNKGDGQVIISDINCSRLTIDSDGYLYVSDWKKNEVRRWKRDEKGEGTIVAGGNGPGEQFNQLNCPSYIFVDEDDSLYVSDQNNHRVMKWEKGANEGILVAGGNGDGNRLSQFSSPRGVIVDQLGQIYVADWGNHRIVRWRGGATEGMVVVGGNGRGEQPHQLSGPSGLSFDRQGNLYVVDSNNHRIQKFEVE